ncbi:MAG TPA: 3-dehydroquinate synthase [Pyrinomonadaceae bacterium]
MVRLTISLPKQSRRSEIEIGPGIRLDLGRLVRRGLGSQPRSVCVVSNERVFGIYGRPIVRSLENKGFRVERWLMPEGERHKSFRMLEQAVDFLAEKRFERNDLVVALGGGVVGDLAGFSASIYLRGIQTIQVPTTLLAQIDSSIGGKTGINLKHGKNLVGTFHQPALVVIDTETLASLPPRELVSGFCEMVKQSMIASKSLFSKTVSYLESEDRKSRSFNSSRLQTLIRDHCKFKSTIVANDERESTGRMDATSRRILNFGHTTAHALETITNYRKFRHGEAVGHGMLVAGEISKSLGLLSSTELKSLRLAVGLCGSLPPADDLNHQQILRAIQHDKKNVKGEVNWVLLNGFGSPCIVSGSQISKSVLSEALKNGLRSTRKEVAQ